MNAVTISVKVTCRHCKGQGILRTGRWDDSVYPSRHVTMESDCEQCGGAGDTLERITLDAQALEQLREALLQLGSMA